MKDTKLDELLRSVKPKIQPKSEFTDQVMKRIGTVRIPHHRRRFVNIWTWTMTTASVCAIVAAVLFMPSRVQNQEQAIENPQESQTDTELGVDSDNIGDLDNGVSSRYEQLAQSTQEDIDTITRELSAIDATEYEDAGLSEAALY